MLHDPTTVRAMAGPQVRPDLAVDAYYQTYIWHRGLLYSRYPPGFPALVAAAKLVGGEPAAHWLNPVLYLVLLVVVARLAARLCPHGREAGVATGAAAVWALLVVPVEVHYWGITVARDLPAHLLGLAALLASLDGRAGRAGLALGLAASVRPDAVLWGVSAGAAVPPGRRSRASLARGVAGFLAGAAPLFAYNTVTQGHPLAFTQGSEFQWLFAGAPGVVRAAFLPVGLVSGGAFRLANFSRTFPVHLSYLVISLGAFLPLSVGTLAHATARGFPSARALGPYAIVGLLFYSCWGHGDPRYLVGVSLCLVLLAAAGAVELARYAGDGDVPRARRLATGAAVATVAISAIWLPRDPARGGVALEWSVVAAIVAAGLLPARQWAWRAAALAPALAFAAFGATRIAASSGTHDPFQRQAIERARTALESVLPAGALVLTSPALGRPAENITHYTHAEAHYLGELTQLLSNADLVGLRCTSAGQPFFLLLPAGDPLPFAAPRAWWSAREVARRDGEALRDWFVDPSRAAGGAVLYEARVSVILPPR